MVTTLQRMPQQDLTGAGVEMNPTARDALLVARVIAGDERALGDVYDQHSSLVYGLARRVTQNEVAAQDIAQDVFGWFWERPDKFDPARGSLRAYLGVLTHRRAVDWIRQESATKAREERVKSACSAAASRLPSTQAIGRWLTTWPLGSGGVLMPYPRINARPSFWPISVGTPQRSGWHLADS